MDWILSKMQISEIVEEEELEEEETERTWIEVVRGKEAKMLEENNYIYFKKIQDYENCKSVIDNYKNGAVCLYNMETGLEINPQRLMDYISGGIFALRGKIDKVGENVFITFKKSKNNVL